MKGWQWKLLRFAAPYRGALALVVLLTLVGVGLQAVAPWPLKLIVDHVVPGEPLPAYAAWLRALPGTGSPTGLLALLVGCTVVLFVMSRAAAALKTYLQVGVGTRATHALGARLFDHLQRLSLDFHARSRTGDLVRRITTDTGCVRELLIGSLLPVVAALVSLVTMFVIMWNLDPVLTTVALVVALPLGVLIKVVSGRMTQRTYEQQELEGRVMALAEQTLSALPVIQAFGREAHEEGRFRELSRRTIRAVMRTTASQLQFNAGVRATTALGTALMMAVGGIKVLEGELTVGSLLVFLAYLGSLYAPLETLAYLSSGYAAAAARARRVLEVLDEPPQVTDPARPVPLPSPGGRGFDIRFEHVSFGYAPDKPALDAVDLEIAPGSTTALVGPVGAGKSTLVSLLPRFRDPDTGRVLVAGTDVRSVRIEDLRSHIALVLQEPVLLPLTIEQNIAYGRPGAAHEAIVEAARQASAHDFICALPQGYATMVGERGATLSGGQRQRIAIARALLKDAPVVILDEPTSALDSESEGVILEGLRRLARGRTTIVIAHRLSTVRDADRVVVLERGRILESGTHTELLAAGGLYRKLYQQQLGALVAVR